MGSIMKPIAFIYLNGERNIGRGAGIIASVILNAEYELVFFDTVYESIESVANNIINNNFSIIMISASTLFYKDAINLSKLIKSKNSSIPIILGGAHVTIMREKILEDCPEIDFICVGEGEDFILEFLSKYGTPEFYDIKNLGYRTPETFKTPGIIIINPIRDCTNLDTLPNFKYDLFPQSSIILNSPLPGFCYVFATRGCPFFCNYCQNSYYLQMYKKGYLRTRSVDSVIEELKFVKANYPVQIFYFGDEMILFNKGYAKELFSRVKSEIGLPYGCMVRVETVDQEITDLFKSTGCKYVGMGVECGNEKFRREFLNRNMSNEQIINAFRLLRTIPNIMLTSYNMRGYPVINDAELLLETQKLNSIIKPNIVQMSLFFPFPGTKLYDYCVKHDLIDYNKLNNVQDYFTQSILKEIK
ncbi:MAG: radical SAM protein [Patescibacteria group bacterium]